MTWRKGKKITVKCEVCNKDFEALVSRRKMGWDRFCSKSCANSWRATTYHAQNLRLKGGDCLYRRTNSRSKFKESQRESANHTCQVCGLQQEKPKLDVHRMTRSVMGGQYITEQVIVCCRSCHQKLERSE